MAVYVDNLINFGGDNAPLCFRNKPSCHMYADSLDELHQTALKIGLKPSWFQNSPGLKHYDLTPSKQKLAIKAGAILQSRNEAIAKWNEIRDKQNEHRS